MSADTKPTALMEMARRMLNTPDEASTAAAIEALAVHFEKTARYRAGEPLPDAAKEPAQAPLREIQDEVRSLLAMIEGAYAIVERDDVGSHTFTILGEVRYRLDDVCDKLDELS